MYKYNVPPKTSGVYMITCKINNKKYIGSSVNMSMRIGTHFNRDYKKYPHREFYKDIIKYGFNNFEISIIETCDKEKLIEREQFYYDRINPEYNLIRPEKCSFNNKTVRELAIKGTKEKVGKILKEKYKSDYYKNLFRKNSRFEPIKVVTTSNGVEKVFNSMSEAADYLIYNNLTTGKKCSIVSHIKQVCDNKRKIAYNSVWRYYKTEEVVIDEHNN